MKKLLLVLCFFGAAIIGASWAYADDLAMAATLSATPQMILGTVVKSVSMADPAKGTKSEIVVTGVANSDVHILVTSTTTLWDADAKAIMLDKIPAKSHVNVIYFSTDEGINIGKSIKVLK